MKTKLVLWGHNEKDEKILIALQLRPADNKVDVWTFPETVATDDFARALMNEWRNDKEVAFPEEKEHLERELSVTESLLPENIKVDRGDIVQRAQTEWHFVVLSSKLNDLYTSELADLKEKVSQLSAYSAEVWDQLKGFWGKVQGQVKERNLLKQHADVLRDDTNSLFDKMKQLRSALDEEFRQISSGHVDKFMSKLEGIEKNIAEGVRLPALFDELKGMQRSFREIKLTREHRSKIWNRLDAAFKAVKEKRFGPSANSESSAMERLTRRYNGLIGAIDKMKKSIDRDQEELAFQRKRIDNTDGQLEAQLREAKIKMTEERVRSKGEKYDEMLKTKEDLERRIATQKDKDSKRQQKQEIEAAKVAAKEKIAKQIQESAAARKDDDGKLEKAADAIVKPPKKAKEAVAEKATDIQETASEKVEDVKEEVVEAKEAVVEKAADIKEAASEKVEEVKEVVAEKSEDIKDGLKAAAGVALGAGAAALASLKGAKDAVVDKVSDVKESNESTDAKEAVVEKVADIKEATVEKVEDVKEGVADTKEAVVEKAADIKEAASEKVEDVKEGMVDAKEAMVEKAGDTREGIKGGLKAAAGAVLGAGAVALSSLKDAKDAVVDKATDLKESVEETIEDTPEQITTLETEMTDGTHKEVSEATAGAEEDETLIDKASDVMEDVAEGLSATFKAGAAAIFGAGAAAATALSGKEEEEKTVATNAEENGEEESTIDKVTDVVEDITDAATSTLKNAAGALFGLGAAAATKLSGEDTNGESEGVVTHENEDTTIEDIAAVSEIVEDTDGDDS